MTEDYNQLMRNNNWNVKSPKVQAIIPNIYEMYKEGNHIINMRQLNKYLTMNSICLESHDTAEHLFFYGANDVNMPIWNVFKVLNVS